MDVDLGMTKDFLQPMMAWTTSPTNISGATEATGIMYGEDSSQQPDHGLDTWQLRFNNEWAMLTASDVPVEEHLSAPRGQVEELTGLTAIAKIQSLSDLNVKLYAHAAIIPKPPNSLADPLSWKDKDFAIDRTFQLSQSFINILNEIWPRYLRSPMLKPPSNMPDAVVSLNCPQARPTSDRQPAPLDQGSFLLILSCYLRLLDTYDKIFGNMQACLDRSSITAEEDYVSLPDVKVGSFALPNSSALQITLILQLARHLLNRVGEIVKSIQLAGNDSTATSDDIDISGGLSADTDCFMSQTLKAVNIRESTLVKRINALRNTLIDLNIL